MRRDDDGIDIELFSFKRSAQSGQIVVSSAHQCSAGKSKNGTKRQAIKVWSFYIDDGILPSFQNCGSSVFERRITSSSNMQSAKSDDLEGWKLEV
jgi:hypothetical protein